MLFNYLGNTYTRGLPFILATLLGSGPLLFTGQVLAIRMGEFFDKLSVAEAMGDMYGKRVRILSAASGILAHFGIIAVQFQVLNRVLAFVFGLESSKGLVVFASVVAIVYSAFGGIRSVTLTDAFQFMTFSIFIPILALIIWNNLQEPGQVMRTLTTNPIFSWRNIEVESGIHVYAKPCYILFNS